MLTKTLAGLIADDVDYVQNSPTDDQNKRILGKANTLWFLLSGVNTQPKGGYSVSVRKTKEYWELLVLSCFGHQGQMMRDVSDTQRRRACLQ